jgi:hypothetical protein
MNQTTSVITITNLKIQLRRDESQLFGVREAITLKGLIWGFVVLLKEKKD